MADVDWSQFRPADDGAAVDWSKFKPAPKKTGAVENITDTGVALKEGVFGTGRSLKAAAQTLAGDNAGVEQTARDTAAAEKASQAEALTAFKADIARRKAADDSGIWQGVKNVAGAAWDNPAGAAQTVAEQLPNSAVSLGGAAIGFKAGAMAAPFLGPLAPVAPVAGAVLGMFLGNAALETGGKAQEKASGGKFTDADRAAALKEGVIKGAVVTGVDAATFGATKLLYSPVGKAMERASADALTKAGVDIANEAAVRAAIVDPAIRSSVEAAQKAAATAALGGARGAARGAAAVGLETSGEALGEGLGEYAATGKYSPTEAVLEGFASLGQSGAEIALAKSSAKAKGLINSQRGPVQEPTLDQTMDQMEEQLDKLMASSTSPAEVINAVRNEPTVDGAIEAAAAASGSLAEMMRKKASDLTDREVQNRLEVAAIAGDFSSARGSLEAQLEEQGVRRAMQAVEQRGGVATPEEAAILDRASPRERLYDSVLPAPPAPTIEGAPAPAAAPTAPTTPAPAADARAELVGSARDQLVQQRLERAAGLAPSAPAPSPSLIVEQGMRTRDPGRLDRLRGSVEARPQPLVVQAPTAPGAKAPAPDAAASVGGLLVTPKGELRTDDTGSLALAPRPTRINGQNPSTLSDEQLQQIAQDESIPAVSRRGAETELAARKSERETAASAPAPKEFDTGNLELAPKMSAQREDAGSDKRGEVATEDSVATSPYRHEESVTVDPATLSDQARSPEGRMSKQTHRFITLLARLFGKKVVVFSSSREDAPDGYVRSGDSKTIYLNVNSQQSHLVVFGHELLHQIKATSPKGYEAIRSIIKIRTGKDINGSGLNGDMEEVTADLVGNLFADTKFWTDVFNQLTRPEAVRLGELISSVVSKFQRALGGLKGFDTGNLVENLGEVRQAAVGALAQYAREQLGMKKPEQVAPGANQSATTDTVQKSAEGDRRLPTRVDDAVARVAAAAEAGKAARKDDTDDRLRAAAEEGSRLKFSGQRNGQEPAAASGGQQSRVVQKAGDAPRYGTAQQDSLPAVSAWHFSQQSRPVLSSASYGQGLKGSGREQFLNATDPRSRQRIYFYVDKGNGIHPEAGVGGAAHEVVLENLYDADADVRRLKRGGDWQAFESAVLDAGFDGYLYRDHNLSAAAVLIGPRAVKVAYRGQGKGATQGGKGVPANDSQTVQWGTFSTGPRADLEAQAERMRGKSSWSGYDIRVTPAANGFARLETRKKLPTLNVGLSTAEVAGGGSITEDTVREALERMGVPVADIETQQSDTEQTAVVTLARELTPEEGDQLSQELQQEAIALRRPDGTGELYGPKAQEWGPFNPEFFVMPGGARAGGEAVRASAKRPEVRVVPDENGNPIFDGPVTLGFAEEVERFEVIPEEGKRVLRFTVMPKDEFDALGHVDLLMEGDTPVSLLDIVAYDRGGGTGRKVIETLLANGGDLEISNIVEGARAFWAKMGVPEQNRASGEAYDGTLNWDVYSQAARDQARGAAPGRAQERGAADGRADAGAESRVQGEAGEEVTASAKRTQLDPDIVQTLGKHIRNLTPAERAKLRRDTAARLVDTIKQLPSANEMAAVAYAGRAKRGWYFNSAVAIEHVFGADGPRFAALLAAMSPQTSVEANLYNALSTWKNWVLAGRPTTREEIVEVMGRSVQGNKGVDSVLDAWINNSVRALASEDPSAVTLSGPKVNSFMLNLRGHVDEVTNDAWMASYALVDQKIFAGKLTKGGDPGKGVGYLAMSARVREAAKTLTRLTGEEWTPAEVQETVWSWAKTLYETASVDRSAEEIINDRGITDAMLQSTPDFRTLFHDDVNEQLLRDAGLGDQVASLRRRGDLAPAGGQVARAEGEAAPFDRNAQEGYEVRAARRLDELRARGAADEVKASAKRQTETPEFKRWFGDSKVVDAEGKPLVVYTGTSADKDFSKFKAPKNGIWFAADPAVASDYAVENDSKGLRYDGSRYIEVNNAPRVMPVYLALRNPKVYDAWPDSLRNASNYKRAQSLLWENLRAQRYDGVIGPGGTYVAFKPEQIKSAIGNDGSFDATDPDIRSSAKRNNFGQTIDSTWSMSPDSKTDKFLYKAQDKFLYKAQDKFIDLKRLTEAVQGERGRLGDELKAYDKETLFHGRAAKRTKDFLDFEVTPLLREMREAGIDLEKFETFLHNRHAPERNRQVASLEGGMPDGGSGIKTADALAYLRSLPTAELQTYERFAAQIDAIGKGTRDYLVAEGLEKQETITAWEDAYKHYVPLNRVEFESIEGNGTGMGYSVRSATSRRAMGSDKPVGNIIGNLVRQREAAITRAEKNRIGKSLFALFAKHPNPEFALPVSPKFFERDINDIAQSLIDLGMDTADAMNIAQEEKQRRVEGNKIKWSVNPALRGHDNVLALRVNGEDHYVFFNKMDERAMRLARSLKNLDVPTLGGLMKIIGAGTRWLSQVNTQYNPVFGIFNFMRDFGGALINLTSTPLAGAQGAIARNALPALFGILADLRAHRRGEKPTSKWAQDFEEFQLAGGQTGYRDLFASPEDRQTNLKLALDPSSWTETELGRFFTAGGRLKVPLEAARKAAVAAKLPDAFGLLSDYNEAIENSLRLAAYREAKNRGMSQQEAAVLAKNLTVNFNRKGQVATQAGALYGFFNAAVQGSARLAETLQGPAGKRIIAGGLLLGVLQAMMLAAAGFGDDEPPEFVRDRSLLVPYGDGKYAAVPLPLGLHVLPATARRVTEFTLGGFKNPAKFIGGLLGLYADAFNPVGGGSDIVAAMTPSVADPAVALARNKDWTGRPIAKEDFSSLNPTPGHTRARDTASAWSRGVAEFLNWSTGGTDYKPGQFSPTPDQLDYLLGQVFGGVAREAGKISATVTASATGQDLPTYKIPLVGRLLGDVNEAAAERGRYYETLRLLNMHEAEIKGRRKNGQGATVAEYIRENPEARLITAANDAEKDVAELQRRKKELVKRGANPETVRLLEERIARRMKQLNDRVRALKEAA